MNETECVWGRAFPEVLEIPGGRERGPCICLDALDLDLSLFLHPSTVLTALRKGAMERSQGPWQVTCHH